MLKGARYGATIPIIKRVIKVLKVYQNIKYSSAGKIDIWTVVLKLSTPPSSKVHGEFRKGWELRYRDCL